MLSREGNVLKAMPCPKPTKNLPAMKQARLCRGAKVCIMVAMMVTRQPIPMPHRRPRKSACSR